MRRKPNVVLITLDSLRADFVGYQNEKEKNTPFLDAFAKKSYVFTHAIAPANPTFFTFCSIMTGTLPFAFGNYLGIPDNKKINTIAQVLKDQGYQTYAFLANSPALYAIYGYDRGFDLYEDGYESTSLRSITGEELNKKAEKYLQKRGNEPFFLWLHYMDTHFPFLNGLDKYFYKNMSEDEREMKMKTLKEELKPSAKGMKIKDEKTTEIFKEAYRSCVKYADQATGKMVTFFQNNFPNTIFVIVSDHGEALMEHGMFGHEPYSLYSELINVPMIIHVPSVKPKRVTKTVSLVSLAKTISELVGVHESQFQGNNLLKDMTFSPLNNISRILYKCRSPHVRLGILDNKTEIRNYKELWSYTTEEEKYITEEDQKHEEFYDLINDSLERNNLIGNTEKNSQYFSILKKYIKG